MRVSKEQAARNRQKILQAAARLLREQGLENSGVAEIMSEAGFTHGGFYGHFDSKADLAAQTVSHIFAEKIGIWGRELAEGPEGVRQLARRYLSLDHVNDAATACPLVSLSADAARHPGPLREAYTQGVKGLVAVLASKLGGVDDPDCRARAILMWTRLAGAVSLARSVDDERLAEEILAVALEGALEEA